MGSTKKEYCNNVSKDLDEMATSVDHDQTASLGLGSMPDIFAPIFRVITVSPEIEAC